MTDKEISDLMTACRADLAAKAELEAAGYKVYAASDGVSAGIRFYLGAHAPPSARHFVKPPSEGGAKSGGAVVFPFRASIAADMVVSPGREV